MHSRTVGRSSFRFLLEPGAFGAAIIKGWMHSSSREQAYQDLALLRRACGGRSPVAFVGRRGKVVSFDVRVEKPALCPVHFRQACTCSAANPFRIAARLMKQSNLNRAAGSHLMATHHLSATVPAWQMTRDEWAAHFEVTRLGRPMDAAEKRQLAEGRTYHASAVREAVLAGEAVPSTVLQDYPELLLAYERIQTALPQSAHRAAPQSLAAA